MPAYLPLHDPSVRPTSYKQYIFSQCRRVGSRAKLCLLVSFGLLSILVLSFRSTAWRDLGYLLRPLWDTPPTAFTVIPHYDHPNVSAGDICILHGWKKRPERARVWDATIFSVELDLLEIRLRELYPVVDHFIIVESNTTFTGHTKPLLFAQHRHEPRFAWASDKIIYSAITLPSEIPGVGPAEATWSNERRSRREINSILRSYGAQSGELMIQADVDEIPSARTIGLIRECEGYPAVLHLQLRNYMFAFTRRIPETKGGGSWRASVKTWDPSGVGYTGYMHGRQSDAILADAGWHCSWCFRYLEDFRFKMTSYSHFDRVTRPRSQLDLAAIQRKVCEGKDLFDMLPEAYTFRDLAILMKGHPLEESYIDLPWWIVQKPEQYAYLLRQENCMREVR
ncbi:glycosyltransferase family 17 protein [Wolfiporia cocos MD-104 SS10]|uniref:Glycosyltransferase family 17 protein n=1 Tax=Wolfiporia cocos (strain MD-104) TaxID=742152 RepID=A0A2H3JE14_WOLCO|nr:glycosyltransferase family 17 protein [Wolfiporia cocos MD-104 SS10]